MDLQQNLAELEEALNSSPEEGLESSTGDDGNNKEGRFIWTPELQWKFAVAVEICGGPKCAVPTEILKVISAQGLTRHKVASHLQKYRARLEKENGVDRVHGSSTSCSDGVVQVSVAGVNGCPVDVYRAPVVMDPSPNPSQSCLVSQVRPSVSMNMLHSLPCHDSLQINMNSSEKGGHTKKIKRTRQHEDGSEDSAVHPKRKKECFLWSPNTHRKFVSTVESIGIKKAVPIKIMELMEDDRLSRHVVASHLQKYRMHSRKKDRDGPHKCHGYSISGEQETLHRQEGLECFLNNTQSCNNGHQLLQDVVSSNWMQPQNINVTNDQIVAIHDMPVIMTLNVKEREFSLEDFSEFEGSYYPCSNVRDFEMYQMHSRKENGDGPHNGHDHCISGEQEILHRQEEQERFPNNTQSCNNGHQLLQDVSSNWMKPQEITVTNDQIIAIHDMPIMMTPNIEDREFSLEKFPEFEGSYDSCFNVQDFEGEVDVVNEFSYQDFLARQGEINAFDDCLDLDHYPKE